MPVRRLPGTDTMRPTFTRSARPRPTALAALVVATATLGACGGEDDDDAPVDVVGTARVVETPPAIAIENRTVLKSVPVNALPRPEPAVAVAPEPEPEPEPVATIVTDVEEVVIAPEATPADVEAVGESVGARTTAPVAADDLVAETDVTPSVPDNTSDNPPWNGLVSDWTGSVALLRERFGELGEDELLRTRGDRNRVVSIMENRMGLARDDAERQLDEFARSLGES